MMYKEKPSSSLSAKAKVGKSGCIKIKRKRRVTMRGLRNESKIEVKGILITRKNGSTKCPYNIVVVTWEESDAIFKLWAKGATGNGGFETCDFRVVFEDGFSYSGTFYLKQQDVFGRNLLPKHIRNICDETRIGWDADSFLNSYSIPATA